MHSRVTKQMDLIISQALERYAEMTPQQARETIKSEWPEQFATIIADFVCKTCCSYCGGPAGFVDLKRQHDDTTFLAPVCDCNGEVGDE